MIGTYRLRTVVTDVLLYFNVAAILYKTFFRFCLLKPIYQAMAYRFRDVLPTVRRTSSFKSFFCVCSTIIQKIYRDVTGFKPFCRYSSEINHCLPIPNICHLLGPSCFSLVTTFKKYSQGYKKRSRLGLGTVARDVFYHTFFYFTIISNCRKSMAYALNMLNAAKFHPHHIFSINLTSTFPSSYTGMTS